MENVDSPSKSFPQNLSTRPIERNVLKEFNYIDGTTKSTKEAATGDQPGILHTKHPASLTNQSPVIGTNSDSNAANKNLLNVTTTTEVQYSDDEFLDISNVTQSPSVVDPKATEKVFDDKLNATCTLPMDGSSPHSQDATFISTNPVINQTIVIESEATKLLDDNIETPTKSEPESSFDATEAIQALSETLEMKEDDPTSTPPDQCLSIVTADQIFSSRKPPAFSEMFHDSTTPPTTGDVNNGGMAKDWNASFVVEKPEKSANSTIVLNAMDRTMVIPKVEVNVDSKVTEFEFKPPSIPLSGKSNKVKEEDVDNFMVLNSNDFDYLQSRGLNSPSPDDDPRSSLLLRFDPLAKPSVPTQGADLHKTLRSSDDPATDELPSNGVLVEVVGDMNDTNSYMNNVRIEKNGDKVISVDGVLLTNKKIDITSVDENIRKKMEEYEATQEILLKRITEKDKAINKTSNVLELYEKAIAEALAAKEKLSQNYEKENEELKADRDVTFQHLLSLESTFADLHMKFERNVQYTGQLQEKLSAVTEDKSKAEDFIRQQEIRYDKMKSHTMQQFDIANAKLEQQTKTISLDNTKLKAQIKREEIQKNAVAEELSQKKKENEELVKICDELISGQRN